MQGDAVGADRGDDQGPRGHGEIHQPWVDRVQAPRWPAHQRRRHHRRPGSVVLGQDLLQRPEGMQESAHSN